MGKKSKASQKSHSTEHDSAKSSAQERIEPPKPAQPPQQPDNDEEEDEEESGESDEEEDEEGVLVTENIDKGINEVLAALRSNSKQLNDKSVRFFPEVGAEGTAEAQAPTKREKPVYLKDYQRSQLLSKASGDDEEEEEKPAETYVQQQDRLRSDLINQFHANDDEDGNGDGGDDDDDGLLQKRKEEREIPEVELPDPENDEAGFLDAFISQKAWIPKKEEAPPTYDEVVDDGNEDSDEFDDLSEKFESAYNFRYEDPNAAEIVSYARDQNTLRRGKKSSRQKKRDKEREQREKEEEQKKLELARMRKAKVNEVTDKMAKLQEALGEGDEKLAEMLSKEDLDGDFDQDEWDKRMQRLFDEEYYGRNDDSVDEAINRQVQEIRDEEGEDLGESLGNQQDAMDVDDTQPQYEEPQTLSRKELKRKAEKFVAENEDLLIDETIKPKNTFRYRSVEPETFGLTARDILLASDKDLNQFVGLKKLASYRDKEKMEHDRRRYSKRKRLRQWRKDVFGSEDVPSDELWEKYKQETAAAEEAEAPKAAKTKYKSKKRKHN